MSLGSGSGDASPDRPGYEFPTLRGFVRGHKAISAAVIGLVLIAVAFTVAAAVLGSSARASALTDASTCSDWSSAGPALQTAYSRRYIAEHGGAGFLSVAALTSAIRTDCATAAYLGESDDLSVVAALKHAF